MPITFTDEDMVYLDKEQDTIIYCLFYINKLYSIYLLNLIKSLSGKIVLKTLEGYGIRVIIAAFSLKGAKNCTGLDVKNYDHDLLAEFLGEDFKLLEYFDHTYHMPSGEPRPYIYTLFQKA
jgi:hypothetical protein